ncbi:sodium-dependent phosphate transporter, partial [Clostridium perfringens]
LLSGILGNFVSTLSPGDVSRQIANAHTVFNIVNTAIMLPLTGVLIKIVNRIIPGDDEEDKPGPKYIDDRLLETPVIAAGQVAKETLRMANKAKKGLALAIEAFESNDEKLIKKVYDNEVVVNTLNEAITTYLVKLSKCDLSDKELSIVAATFHVINDIERIGDHAKNIAALTEQKISKKFEYSNQAIEQLHNMYNKATECLDVAID